MKFAKRVQDLPPYLFVGISRAIAKKKEQGTEKNQKEPKRGKKSH